MKKVIVLLGDFTFLEPTLSRNNNIFEHSSLRHRVLSDNEPTKNGHYEVIINRIDDIVEVLEEDLDDFCERSLEEYECYLIPSQYSGTITIN